MNHLLKFCQFYVFGLVVVLALAAAAEQSEVKVDVSQGSGPLKIRLNTHGKDVHLNLRKPDAGKSVLSPGIHFLIGDVDEAGKTIFHRWTPSVENIKSAQDVYIDSKAKASLRVHNTDGEYKLNGIVDGVSIVHNGEQHVASSKSTANRHDYIDIKRNLTFTPKSVKQAQNSENIVELLLVCDKEFGDVFGHNYQRILEYFTVLMWDVNLRYKTMKSVSISWRISGIVVLSTPASQPFIEQSRAGDGRVNHIRVLEKFSFWVYQQRNSLPKFDLAAAVTNAAQEWDGGYAYLGAACRVDTGSGRNLGTSVWNDGGNWGPMNVVPHEFGHNLGAPHDDDSSNPGGCGAGSYIMGGSTDQHRFFFSACSERTIGNFVKSDQASCLRTLSSGNPAVSPEFNSPPAPTMAEQCRRRINNPKGYVDSADCLSAVCKWPGENGATRMTGFAPLDNSPCANGGRCFRGKCRQAGYLFKNVASGLCMKVTDGFEKMAQVTMQPCPSPGNALDRFVVSQGTKGSYMETPYIEDGSQSLDRCTWTGDKEGDGIWTDSCGDHSSAKDNPWHNWELRDAGNGQFLLYHKVTGRCAKPRSRATTSSIGTYAACDSKNPDFKWTRTL